jgi:tetratricopeptide (TPR) repeat protein
MLERKAAISLLLALASSIALAQDSQKSKTVGELLKRIEKNTKRVSISKSSVAVPTVQKQHTAIPDKAFDFKTIKPPSRSRLLYQEGTNEAELQKMTDDGIAQLYKLSRQFKTSSRRGELWLRLAELYVEKSRLIEYKLQTEHDKAAKAWSEDANHSGKAPKLDLRPAQEFNKKAVQLYEAFLHDFPKDSKVDQALFFLGYNYFELDKAEKGHVFYERLVKEYPESPYIEESNFALGEFYFDHEKWKDAEARYDVIARNKHAHLYSFALYKKAWCQYKLGEHKAALASLEKVIRAGRAGKNATAGGVSNIRLAGEATKDLVVFYAEAGDPKDARAYFEDIVGRDKVFPLMESLAYHYSDIGNRTAARDVFKELESERPTAPKSFDYQYRVVTMYSGELKNDTFKQELFFWIKNFGPGSEWYKGNEANHQLTAKSMALIENTLRTNILQNHQSAQNSHSQIAQKQAKEGYEIYFQSFKDGKSLDEMHFFYAELLFDMGEFEKAAVHYTWVTDNAPKSKYFEKASLNTILSLEKKLPKEEDLRKNVKDNDLKPIAFPPAIKAFQVAVDKYVVNYPNGENVPAIRYKLGALYYYHNQFDEALNVFNSIIKQYPKSPYAKYAANLTLDIYNLKKDYAGLETAGNQILQNNDLAKTEIGDQVKGVLQRVGFKKGQDLESKKDYAGAAKSFEEFGRANPGTDLGTSAMYNSAVDYEKAGDSNKALGMYGLILQSKDPKHEDQRKNARKFSAQLYERTGQYEKAAQAFEEYAKSNAKDKEAQNFYYNAAVIRDGMNSYNAALSDYETYIDTSKTPDRKENLFLMAKIWERRGNQSKALDFYQKYYDSGAHTPAALVETCFAIADINSKRKNVTEADKWYNKTIAVQRKVSTKDKPVGVSFAAESKFHVVYHTYEELRAIKIPANPAKQGKAVQEKLAKLNQVKEQLKSVIAYDNAEMIVASLTLIGQAYQHMAAAIYAVPAPKADAEQLKAYQQGVDKIARPFQDEAVKNYELAVQRGYELEGYNDWLKASQKELGTLQKDKSQDFGEKAVLTKVMDNLESSSGDNLKKLKEASANKDEAGTVAAATQILGQDSKNLEALNALAVHYYNQGKFGLSKILIMRALSDHGDSATLYNNLGVIYLTENKQKQAMGSFRKALELQSKYPFAALNLGGIYLEFKDNSKAASVLESGYNAVKSDLRRGNYSMDVGSNYAQALSGSGQLEKAKDVFKKLIHADDQNTGVLYNYAVLLIARMKDMKEGSRILEKVKFIADDSLQKKISELEKLTGGT